MLTDIGALTSQQRIAWSMKTWLAGRDQSFWSKEGGMMGEDGASPVHYVTELTQTNSGTRAILTLTLDLEGDGVVDDNILDDNEEAIEVGDIEIKVSQLRHGVKSKGKLSEKKAAFNFRAKAKDTLAYWYANKTEELMFLVASGIAFSNKLNGTARAGSSQWTSLAFAGDVTAPSTNRKVFAGSATSTATLTASDTMSWDLLIDARTKAERSNLKPIRVKGKPHYVVVMSPEQAGDLKQDSDYINANKDGQERGEKNPLFSGALSMVDGLILYSHRKVYNTLGAASGSKWGAGSTVDGAQALLLGAQAIGFAEIGTPDWSESDKTDYGNKQGIGYGCMFGIIKPVFQSRFDNNAEEDFGIISIYTAAASR